MANLIPPFELVGGNLALDFTNTVSCYRPPVRNDKLTSYAVLLAFAEQTGAVSPKQARALRRAAAERPEEAAATLQSARELRDVIYRIFYARSHQRAPVATDLAALNRALTSALAHRRLELRGDDYVLDFDRDGDALDAPLWPIVAAAVELLSGGACGLVRVCSGEDDDCTWLFVDETKNHSRRWCSMKDCGNRAKARRHYAREKLTSREP